MEATRREELVKLDVALLALRRMVDAPSGHTTVLRHGEERVEVSTMLVVDAVARSTLADRCSIGEVAETLHVTHSTASRLVDRAVKAGMVDRTRQVGDPRRTSLVLTDAGERLQRDAVRFRTDRLAHILGDWPAADVAAFIVLMERFARDALDPGKRPEDPLERPSDRKGEAR